MPLKRFGARLKKLMVLMPTLAAQEVALVRFIIQEAGNTQLIILRLEVMGLLIILAIAEPYLM